MTEAFRSRGYRALLLAGEVPAGESSMEFLAEQRGVERIRINGMSRPISLGRDLRALWRIVSVFRREKPAIVHTHTAKAGTLGRIAAMLTGVPGRVHTFHGHVFSGYFSPAKTRIFLAIERFLAKHTDRIIAVSESQRHELVNVYKIAPADKVVTIPLGLDLAPFQSSQGGERFRRMLGCDDETLLVGWAGRLTAIKNPDLLLDVAEALRATDRKMKFVLVGDGELRDGLQGRIRSAGLADIVSLAGSREDMADVYAGLDFLLLTSRNEGTPVVLLEAMAAGKTFVCTDVGGVRDLMIGTARPLEGCEIFQNGILARSDPVLLARAVQFLSADAELRARMGACGREFVAQRFTAQRLADDLERLYAELRAVELPAGAALSTTTGEI